MSHSSLPTRRRLLECAGLAAVAPAAASDPQPRLVRRDPVPFPDIVRPPDRVTAYAESYTLPLKRSGTSWQAEDIVVTTEPRGQKGSRTLPVTVTAPQSVLLRIHLRWLGSFPRGWRYLGDAWERGYGELEWRGLAGERVMPWYFLASDGRAAHGYGVRTGAGAFCFWQADAAGISLWLDVRNGGAGVRLGERQLEAAEVVALRSAENDSPFRSAQKLCRALCSRPRLPSVPVYGWNTWYYTYGAGMSATNVLRDSGLLASLAPATASNRPFMIIDEGWGVAAEGAGPWQRGGETFPDMAGLAHGMKQAGVRPGIWIRPLLTTERLPEAWRMPANRFSRPVAPGFFVLDPSVPDALEHVRQAVRTVAGWGYELIKHDYTTFDILGRWGFQMGAGLTSDGWHFADRGRTSAEIISGLYRAIREAAGVALLIGCNTVGHLGAGLFEMQRIGDDNGSKDWDRARRMGVNALGFRVPQHTTFFAVDADCVVLSKEILWSMSRQWLDLLSRSGTPLFVSADPALLNAEKKRAIREAFAAASTPQPPAEPLDWMETTAPGIWLAGGRVSNYDWFGREGVWPFSK